VSPSRSLQVQILVSDVRGFKTKDCRLKYEQYNYTLGLVPTRINECSSAMAQRPRELGDLKGVGDFEVEF